MAIANGNPPAVCVWLNRSVRFLFDFYLILCQEAMGIYCIVNAVWIGNRITLERAASTRNCLKFVWNSRFATRSNPNFFARSPKSLFKAKARTSWRESSRLEAPIRWSRRRPNKTAPTILPEITLLARPEIIRLAITLRAIRRTIISQMIFQIRRSIRIH